MSKNLNVDALGVPDGTATIPIVISRTVDPTAAAGVAAPLGSVLMRTLAGSVQAWQKTTAPNTGWTQIGAPLLVEEEGAPVVATDTMNFVGAGVTATNVLGVATITIPGATTPSTVGNAASVGLTWRPGSLAVGPIVWDDWDLLYAYLDGLRTAALVSGDFVIIFDDQSGPLNLPAGSYNMDRVSWEGVRGVNLEGTTVDITLDPGTIMTKPAGASWLLTGVRVQGNCPDGFGIILDVSQTLNLFASTLYQPNGASVVTVLQSATILLDENSKIMNTEGQAAVRITANATLTVRMDGARSEIVSSVFSGDGTTTLNILIGISSAILALQAGVTGTKTFTQLATAWRFTASDPNAVIAAGIGLLLVGSSGTLWRNSDGGTTWVVQTSVGDPNGVVPSALGHLIIDVVTGFTWVNTDGATAWSLSSGGGGSLPPERLAASGAASPTISTTYISGVATLLTLANGTIDGFVKNFVITGGSGTITPANLQDGNVFTWTAAPANVSCIWDATLVTWHVFGTPYNMVTT